MNILERKLSSFIDLDVDDRRALVHICQSTRPVPAGRDLINVGDRPQQVFLLMEGWAYRYKMLPDGRRQILAYLVPGDLCDVHIFILKKMDHAIGVLSPSIVAAVPQQRMLEIMAERPSIERALWWSTLVDEAILREWLVNMGQRDAFERMAHLFCELWVRLRAVGLVNNHRFALPLTQAELGDTIGLTPVHVNRTLQRMRADGLISLDRKELTIHEPERLAEISGFEPNYLHLERSGRVPGTA